MNNRVRRSLLASSILSVVVAGNAYAHSGNPGSQGTSQSAQDQTKDTSTTETAPPARKALQLEGVMVTAQHREEEVQKIPISISTIGGVQLDRMQVASLQDVKFEVPNMTIDHNTGLPSGAVIGLRGVSQSDSVFTADPAVGLYIDDVYIPRTNGAMLDLYDVERIEVLRGPQGTLYGRNSTGGAIRYITRKPDGKDSLNLNLKLGNFGRRDLRATFGTKIGKIDVSGGVMSRNRDGYMHDLTHDRTVNDSHINAMRLELATAVSDNTYARLSLDYLRDTSGSVFASPAKLNANGQVVPALGSFYNTRTNVMGNYGMWQYGVAFSTDTDFGSFSLRNILHTRAMNMRFYNDFDGTDRPIYAFFQDQKQRQYGYEAQLVSQIEGPFSWVGGFFSFRETNSQPTRSDIFATGPTNNVSQQTDALALYWQGTYKFTDRLSLIGGVRYSWEQKNFLLVSTKVNGSPNFGVNRSEIWTHPDWKVTLDYDFTKNIMGYVSVTTGFKSGGFNGRSSTAALVGPVAPETVRSYETGVKSSLFNDRVQLNADYYRNDYKALQLTAVLPTGEFTLTNATGALIQGVEMDAKIQLAQQWSANAGFGTIDAKYRNYAEINRATFSGIDMKHAPRFQWYLSSTYVQPLASADLVWSMRLKYTDTYFTNQDNNHIAKPPTHLDAGARIAYEPRNKNWSVALWGQNLTNNRIPTDGFDIKGLGVQIVYPTMPRTYGMEFNYRFF